MFLEGLLYEKPESVSDYEDGSHRIESRNQPILVYDFFSGCGGTSEGLRNAGMKPVMGLDIDHEAMATYAHNFKGAEAVHRNVCDLATSDLEHLFERDRKSPILFSACAPCQPFSRQNRQRKEQDSRISLLAELGRFVRRFRPELIFIENVPGMQAFSEAEDGPLTRLFALLDACGYSYTCRTVEAQTYGVPQNRRRLVVVASLFGPFAFPNATHGSEAGMEPLLTVRKAIAHLPPLEAGMTDSRVANHQACGLSAKNLERIRAVSEGGDRRSWSDHLKLDCHVGLKGYTDVYGRMSWDKPSPSLTTRCVSLSNGRFGHPEQDRAISIREAARIQSFPDDFEFRGTINAMARQIGNAVPPKLAEVIGRALIAHVDHYRGLA
ncbi:DNA cytosine methyltransferase [Brucella pseudogrignonensis]|uniref:DNA cytosine methyltransferase n=1 Tax=Brucella pseudogrignonensis TaxID=419475 RepID=UPI00124BEE64|nr:DNA cytosine methyltransferase [Brucella pseudogrignonensis]KAB2684298.1 DNA cytosine methyltransferase [Brucella pseudogrignonensis]